MPFDSDALDNLDAVIDGLSSPTTLETWRATDDYDSGMVAASAVRRALATGGGGAGATDTVVTMDVAEPPAPFGIVSVPGDGSIVLAGDRRALIPAFALLLDAGFNFRIAGSTANDGDYVATGASYDSGTNRTTFTCDGGPTDTTPDGTFQAYFTSLFELVLPPQSTVEWVYYEVTEAFDFDDISAVYSTVWAGDSDSFLAFCAGPGRGHDSNVVDLTTIGSYQWPNNTLNPPSGATVCDGLQDDRSTLTGIRYYPGGSTVTLLVSGYPASQVGSVRVTIHHHFDEVGTPTVNGG